MIPMSRDVAELIGPFAERVGNRSLLFEKFPLPKVWGHDRKCDDAARWNVLRISDRGAELLRLDAKRERDLASGKNVSEENRLVRAKKAEMADRLAVFSAFDPELGKLGAANSAALLNQVVKSYGPDAVSFEDVIGGRLLINLAGGVVENAGICLDRCFGVPMIPGSAVKGIARSQALWSIREAGVHDKRRLLELALVIFGFNAQDLCESRRGAGDFAWAAGEKLAVEVGHELSDDSFRGCVCFLPSRPVSQVKIVVDIVNPHHGNYYRGAPVNSDERPSPNYFPAVEVGAKFGFGLVLLRNVPSRRVSSATILKQAENWIKGGLSERGVGAKTGGGYGWFMGGRVEQPFENTASGTNTVSETQQSASDRLLAKFGSKCLENNANFPVVLQELAAVQDETELRQIFETICPASQRHRLKKNNPFWQSFTSGKHGDAGRSILRRLGLELK